MNKKERREELVREADALEKELFRSRIRKLEAEYEKEEHWESMRSMVSEVFRRWMTRNEGRAASLGIGYLYSSILMRTYGFKLTLYGEDFYLDGNPIEYTWVPSCFFDAFEEDMPVIMSKLRKKYPRLYSYEEEAVRYRCVEYYIAAVYKLCADRMGEILEGIFKGEEFSGLNRTEDFFCFFGRYGGEGEILWRDNAEGGERNEQGKGRKIFDTDFRERESGSSDSELVRKTGCKEAEPERL